MSPGDAIHVWRVALDAVPSELLAPDEAERARRLHFEVDRRRFVGSHAALRIILGACVGASPADLSIVTATDGKPRLDPGRHGTDIRFNLSHSHEVALVAIGCGREVGVDVEHHRPMRDLDTMLARFFSTAEQDALAGLSGADRTRAFFQAWTLKEAYLKGCGDGVSRLDAVEVLRAQDPAPVLRVADRPEDADRWTLTPIEAGEGYSAALAVDGRGWRLRQWNTAVTSLAENGTRAGRDVSE